MPLQRAPANPYAMPCYATLHTHCNHSAWRNERASKRERVEKEEKREGGRKRGKKVARERNAPVSNNRHFASVAPVRSCAIILFVPCSYVARRHPLFPNGRLEDLFRTTLLL